MNANGIIRTYHIRAYETTTGREVYNSIVTKEPKKEESLRVFNLKPYTNFTFTIQAKTIELGERANFTAKTWEGGNFEIFLCVPRRTPFLEAIFFSCPLHLILSLNTYSPTEDFGVNSFSGS